MITWQMFQDAKPRLLDDPDVLQSLIMDGSGYDNATRDLKKKKGTLFELSYSAIFGSGQDLDGCEFVWSAQLGVQIASGMVTGGHPFLAGFDPVNCAGEIMERGFSFRSGHYKPDNDCALHFFYAFVENSCRLLTDRARDRDVSALCQLPLKLYGKDPALSRRFIDGSGDDGFGGGRWVLTTFEKYYNAKIPTLDVSDDDELPMSSSRPISIHAPRVQQSGSSITVTTVSSRTPVLVIPQAPRWEPDSERSTCWRCNASFGVFRRKHHCRACGHVCCDACTQGRKMVRLPARNPSGSGDKAGIPLRVCDACAK